MTKHGDMLLINTDLWSDTCPAWARQVLFTQTHKHGTLASYRCTSITTAQGGAFRHGDKRVPSAIRIVNGILLWLSWCKSRSQLPRLQAIRNIKAVNGKRPISNGAQYLAWGTIPNG